jgi:hypothetical protein
MTVFNFDDADKLFSEQLKQVNPRTGGGDRTPLKTHKVPYKEGNGTIIPTLRFGKRTFTFGKDTTTDLPKTLTKVCRSEDANWVHPSQNDPVLSYLDVNTDETIQGVIEKKVLQGVICAYETYFEMPNPDPKQFGSICTSYMFKGYPNAEGDREYIKGGWDRPIRAKDALQMYTPRAWTKVARVDLIGPDGLPLTAEANTTINCLDCKKCVEPVVKLDPTTGKETKKVLGKQKSKVLFLVTHIINKPVKNPFLVIIEVSEMSRESLLKFIEGPLKLYRDHNEDYTHAFRKCVLKLTAQAPAPNKEGVVSPLGSDLKIEYMGEATEYTELLPPYVSPFIEAEVVDANTLPKANASTTTNVVGSTKAKPNW